MCRTGRIWFRFETTRGLSRTDNCDILHSHGGEYEEFVFLGPNDTSLVCHDLLTPSNKLNCIISRRTVKFKTIWRRNFNFWDRSFKIMKIITSEDAAIKSFLQTHGSQQNKLVTTTPKLRHTATAVSTTQLLIHENTYIHHYCEFYGPASENGFPTSVASVSFFSRHVMAWLVAYVGHAKHAHNWYAVPLSWRLTHCWGILKHLNKVTAKN
jgi:hypothetical protein